MRRAMQITIKALAGTLAASALLAGPALAAPKATELASVEQMSQDYCRQAFKTVVGTSVLAGTYVGQCKAGAPDGTGTVKFANGDRYQGEFAEGKFAGTGTWTEADGSNYTGHWRDGHRNGLGTYHWEHGSTYVGQWFYDRRHGRGTLTWPSGAKFVGEFRNNQYYAGTFYTTNGRQLSCAEGRCR